MFFVNTKNKQLNTMFVEVLTVHPLRTLRHNGFKKTSVSAFVLQDTVDRYQHIYQHEK